MLLLLQRSAAVQVRSSVQLMPQNQPSGRGLLPSPTAWSSDQHPVAMLADISRHTLGRTEGRGLGFDQLVRAHTGKCLKCQSSSDGHSDHNALCAGGRWWSAGPAPVSKLGQGVPDIHRCISSNLHCTESGEVSWPLCRWQDSVSAEPDCWFLQVCLLFGFLPVPHKQAPTGGILWTELSAWQGRSAGLGSSGLDQLSWGPEGLKESRWRWRYFSFFPTL